MNRPNVILLTVDMVRNDMLGRFPVFTKLKEKGVLFSQMITYAPYTIASLHAIFTGLYGKDSKVDAYFKPVKFDKDRCYTLTQYLKDCGYYTQADVMAELTLPKSGFDVFALHDEYNEDLLSRHKKLIEDTARSKAGKNFFLYIHCSNVHTDIVLNVIKKYQPFDENYFGKLEENLKRYESYVQRAANYLEEIILTVDRHNLWEDTIFVVLSDHGCGIGEKPGEKAYGVYTYDYSIKVFAYFIYAKLLPRGKDITLQVRSVDIMPTILDMLNIPARPEYKALEGRSLLPIINGQEAGDRIAFSETGGLEGPHPSPYSPNVKCVRTPEWKLIYNTTTQKKKLYDLKGDPQELNNCLEKYPDIAAGLWNTLKENL